MQKVSSANRSRGSREEGALCHLYCPSPTYTLSRVNVEEDIQRLTLWGKPAASEEHMPAVEKLADLMCLSKSFRHIQHNTLMGFKVCTLTSKLWDRCFVGVDSKASEVWCLFSPLWHSLRVCFMIVEPWKKVIPPLCTAEVSKHSHMICMWMMCESAKSVINLHVTRVCQFCYFLYMWLYLLWQWCNYSMKMNLSSTISLLIH